MEFLGSFVIFFSALFAVLQRDTIGASVAGLSVSFALQVNVHFKITLVMNIATWTKIVIMVLFVLLFLPLLTV